MSELDIILTIISCICAVSSAVIGIVGATRNAKNDSKAGYSDIAEMKSDLKTIKTDVQEIKSQNLNVRMAVVEQKINSLGQ
jgi:hypothetical protein